MTVAAEEIITEIRASGLSICAGGGYIELTPSDRVTDRLIEIVRRNKAGIIEALKTEPGNVGNDGNVVLKLSGGEEYKLRDWLKFIGETDPEVIQALLDQCARDPEALTYFLKHSKNISIEPEPEPAPDYTAICGSCQHFKRIDHPAMGHCSIGARAALDLLWDSDSRQCKKYEETEPAADKPDAGFIRTARCN